MKSNLHCIIRNLFLFLLVFPAIAEAQPCSITDIDYANQGACDDNGTPHLLDDYYTVDVTVTFANPPATGSLELALIGAVLSSTPVPVGSLVGTTHTFTSVILRANGVANIVTARFTDDLSCSFTNSAPAVSSCSGCKNYNPFVTANVPTASCEIKQIATCIFAGEYNTLNNAVAGQTYHFTSSGGSGNYLTVTQGTPGGTILASGFSPVTATVTVSGSIYLHVNIDVGCTTDNICHTTTIQLLSINDLCTNAIEIDCGETITGTTICATAETVPTCSTSFGSSGGVWYKFTGDGSSIELSLCGSAFDTKIGVFTGTCGSFVCVAGNDDFCGLQSKVTFNSITGTEYFVLVTGFGTAIGAFTLTRTCTFNPCDDITTLQCETPVTLTLAGEGVWATNACGFGTPGMERVFSFTPTVTGMHIFEVTSAPGIGILNYFFKEASSGCNETGWTCIFDISATGTIFFGPLTAGIEYYISVDSEEAFSVTQTFQISCPQLCIVSCPPNISVPNDPGLCGAVVNYSISTTGGCGTISSNPPSGYLFPTGSTTVNAFNDGCDTIFGVTVSNNLIRFSKTTPGTVISIPITGLTSGDKVLGIDFRPATGVLYALGVNGATARLYTINTLTADASPVGTGFPVIDGGVNAGYGFDFNPVVDLIRVVSNEDENFRVSPVTGDKTATDTNINPSNVTITGSAYSNNFSGAISTTLYGLDNANEMLVIQGGINGVPSPNTGTATNVGPIGFDISNFTGFDISSCNGSAYASLLGSSGNSELYTINLTTGASTLVGLINTGEQINAMAIAPSAPACTFTVTVIGDPLPLLEITGPAGACRGQKDVVYCATPFPGATSYIWTKPSGATGSSTGPCITLKFNSYFNGGSLFVKVVTPCGTSQDICINIVRISSSPSTPGSITGPVELCPNTCATYSVPASSTATSYQWSGTNGLFVSSGQGTRTAIICAPNGFVSGSIKVSAKNCKGSSGYRTITVTGLPPKPVWYNSGGDNVTVGACAGATIPYEIAGIPGVSVFVWTAPPGVIIYDRHGNSGNPLTTNGTDPIEGEWEVDVLFPPGFISGVISVYGQNACGDGQAATLAVKSKPSTPGSISGSSQVCRYSTKWYSISSVTGANSYTWTVNNGAIIVSGQGTKKVSVKFNSATSPVMITVKANNACGSSATSSKTVTIKTYCRTEINGEEIEVIDDGKDASFIVYPNPTNGKATIEFDSDRETKYRLRVVDMLGRVMIAEDVSAAEGYNSKELNLENAARGVYFVSLETEGEEVRTLRIIIN